MTQRTNGPGPSPGDTAVPGLGREWLEADGIGGFASGTVAGPRTRRYHALLLSPTTPPTGRMVMVNGVEAWLETETGHAPLTSQIYAPSVVHPRGFEAIAAFVPYPWPTWTFRLGDWGAGPRGGAAEVRHELLVDPDAGETWLRWTRTTGNGPCRLVVVPLVSTRDYHALHRENAAFDFRFEQGGSTVSWQPYSDGPATSVAHNGSYGHAPDWYRNFLYLAEAERGLDCIEDLAAPGRFTFDLATGPAIMLLRAGRAGPLRVRALSERAFAAARAARSGNASRARARSYRVDRGSGSTLVAGYPWFTDWGRDTFIAMRGLLVATGELDAAEAILDAWAGAVDEGMMPNRFPDAGGKPEFNSVDASLWYVVAVHDLFASSARAGRSVGAAERLRQACEEILDRYAEGTRFGIGADVDGLLAAGTPGVQLTWMDAKIGDRVITPRIGKPVEIQALWINALAIVGKWAERFADRERRARTSFAVRFANPLGGLYDVVDVDHVPGRCDGSLRPNQILAVGGLPFPLLTGAAARAVVELVEDKLLTPLGLRSLSPDDPAYVGRYVGGPAQRDAAYHQGTVWPWLMGPFVDAWLSARDRDAAAMSDGRTRFLPPFERHLDEAGLGHVSEVADGDPPHRPGGCPFQAWSLGEYLRMRHMLGADDEGENP